MVWLSKASGMTYVFGSSKLRVRPKAGGADALFGFECSVLGDIVAPVLLGRLPNNLLRVFLIFVVTRWLPLWVWIKGERRLHRRPWRCTRSYAPGFGGWTFQFSRLASFQDQAPLSLQVAVPQSGRKTSPNPNFMLQFEDRFGPCGFAKGALNFGTHSILGRLCCQFG